MAVFILICKHFADYYKRIWLECNRVKNFDST